MNRIATRILSLMLAVALFMSQGVMSYAAADDLPLDPPANTQNVTENGDPTDPDEEDTDDADDESVDDKRDSSDPSDPADPADPENDGGEETTDDEEVLYDENGNPIVTDETLPEDGSEIDSMLGGANNTDTVTVTIKFAAQVRIDGQSDSDEWPETVKNKDEYKTITITGKAGEKKGFSFPHPVMDGEGYRYNGRSITWEDYSKSISIEEANDTASIYLPESDETVTIILYFDKLDYDKEVLVSAVIDEGKGHFLSVVDGGVTYDEEYASYNDFLLLNVEHMPYSLTGQFGSSFCAIEPALGYYVEAVYADKDKKIRVDNALDNFKLTEANGVVTGEDGKRRLTLYPEIKRISKLKVVFNNDLSELGEMDFDGTFPYFDEPAHRDGYNFDGYYDYFSRKIIPGETKHEAKGELYDYTSWKYYACDYEYAYGEDYQIRLNGKWSSRTYNVVYHLNNSGSDVKFSKSYRANEVGTPLAIDKGSISNNTNVNAKGFKGWIAKDGTYFDCTVDDSNVGDLIHYADAKGITDIELYGDWEQSGGNSLYDLVLDAGVENFDAAEFASGKYKTATYETKVAKNENIVLNGKEFVRNGYTLTGWTYKDAKGNTVTTKKPNVTLKNLHVDASGKAVVTAQWTLNTYKITYNLNGGSYFGGVEKGVASYTVEDGEISLPEKLSKKGYKFVGWFDAKGVQYKTVGKISGNLCNLALTAKWEAREYIVRFHKNVESDPAISQANYTYDQTYQFDKNLFIRTGYTLNSWNTKPDGTGTKYAVNAKVKNVEGGLRTDLYAIWTPVTYTIRFNSNPVSGKNATKTQKVVFGTETKLAPNTFKMTGAEFEGWSTGKDGAVAYDEKIKDGKLVTSTVDGGIESFVTGPNAVVDLYAQWDYVNYVVFFDAGADDAVSGSLIKGKKSQKNLDVSELAGEDFDNSKGYLQELKYSEQFDLNGDEFERPGYTLTGWKNSKNGKVIKNGTYSNLATKTEFVTLTAQWTANTYKITYNLNGGSYKKGAAKGVASYKVTDGKKDLPTAETIQRTGYTFQGWYDNKQCTGTPVEYVGEDVLKSLTLFAKWEANHYTVVFNGNGGTVDDTVPSLGEGEDANDYEANNRVATFDHDKTYQINKDVFTKTGQVLDSWNTKPDGKGKKYAANAKIKNLESVDTLYAIWKPVTYKITYDLAGGKQAKAPTTYTTEKGAVLKVPTKVGYIFAGWDVSQTEGIVLIKEETRDIEAVIEGRVKQYDKEVTSCVIEGEKDYSGNITLKAKWEPIEYVVLIHRNSDKLLPDHDRDATSYFIYDSAYPDFRRYAQYFEDLDLTDDAKGTVHVTGFNTRADGKGTMYSVDKQYKNLTTTHGQVIELYTQWTSTEQFMIVYDGVDAAYKDSAVATYKSGKAVTLKNPTKTGYVFEGWDIKKCAYKVDENEDVVLGTDPVTSDDLVYTENARSHALTIKSGKTNILLTAKWAPIEYKVVVFDGVSNKAFTVINDVPYTTDKVVEAMSRDGYEFVRFNTRKDGKGMDLTKVTADTYSLAELTTKAKSTVNVYAIWNAKDYAVHYTYVNSSDSGSVIDADLVKNTNVTKGFTGKVYTLSKPSVEGYTFVGYTCDDPSGNALEIKKGNVNKILAGNHQDVEIKAVFTENKYNIKISSNGGVVKAGNEDIGTVNKALNKQIVTGAYYSTNVAADVTRYACRFAKPGFAFEGLALDSKGKEMLTDSTGALSSKSKYNHSNTLRGLAAKNGATVTVFAIWSKVTVDKVTNVSVEPADDSTRISVSYSVPSTRTDAYYEIQCSTNIMFRGADTYVNTGNPAEVDSKDADGNRYRFVRIRQIRTDSAGNKVVGSWSRRASANVPMS